MRGMLLLSTCHAATAARQRERRVLERVRYGSHDMHSIG
jgi:hypothetical protein